MKVSVFLLLSHFKQLSLASSNQSEKSKEAQTIKKLSVFFQVLSVSLSLSVKTLTKSNRNLIQLSSCSFFNQNNDLISFLLDCRPLLSMLFVPLQDLLPRHINLLPRRNRHLVFGAVWPRLNLFLLSMNALLLPIQHHLLPLVPILPLPRPPLTAMPLPLLLHHPHFSQFLIIHAKILLQRVLLRKLFLFLILLHHHLHHLLLKSFLFR